MAELNTNYGQTGGADIGNALLTGMKINYMKNAMAENEVQNALRAVQAKHENLKYQTDLLKFKRDSLAPIAPEEYANWHQMISYYDPNADLLIPPPSTFMEKQADGTMKLNSDRVLAYKKRVVEAASDYLDKKPNWDALWIENAEGKRLPHYQKKGEPIDETTLTSTYGPGWKFVGGAEEKPEAKESFLVYGPKGQTKRVSVTKGEGYTPEAGWSLKVPEKGERLSMTEVKAARDMEMSSIMNRMKIEMSPEEQANFANMNSEQIMASLMSGGGKSLPPAKKQQYISEIKDLDDHYGKMAQGVMGRKGATQRKQENPKPETPTQADNANQPQAVDFLKGAKDRADAIAKIKELKAKGWTKEQLNAIARAAGWE